mmetsp:Transcript_16957/g.41649  ORF Transcript_16957/g.41649 Transcript_16957/m.41649 type:complete len:615 (+) Transcript_16957:209-2053(+)
MGMESFQDLAVRFRGYHTNSLNVALHMVTTPMGIVAALVLLHQRVSCNAFAGVVAAYVLSLGVTLNSTGLWAATTAWVAGLVSVALLLSPSFELYDSLKLMAAAAIGQELSHLITGEKTFASTYMTKLSWPALLLEHTYYLLPLCLDALVHMKESFASWVVAHDYVVRTKLVNTEDRAALKDVYDFVTAADPARDCTAHWWYERLDGKCHAAFSHVMQCAPVMKMFTDRFRSDCFAITPIPSMNEIYVASSHHNNNSDTVFYTQHCDGPWSVYPFCFVYRCMCAVNENVQVETNFPQQRSGGGLSDGDVAGFDYNREIHIISDLPTKNTDRRITLKLHYVIYPKCFGPLGRLVGSLATWYNTAARHLFLATIKPKGLLGSFMAWNVIFWTKRVRELEMYAGLNNVVVAAALFAVGRYVHPLFFMAATSFNHYCMYIATYHLRDRINFGTFKRNVIFFKTIALTHLCWNYLANWEYDPVSMAMLAVGYGLSTAATAALGIDQTYFGVELGVMKPNFVSGFPYNCVPHPMIIGSMVGLMGFHKMASFRAELPFLVPMHCAMYLTHMIQEQVSDIYKNNWGAGETGAVSGKAAAAEVAEAPAASPARATRGSKTKAA